MTISFGGSPDLGSRHTRTMAPWILAPLLPRTPPAHSPTFNWNWFHAIYLQGPCILIRLHPSNLLQTLSELLTVLPIAVPKIHHRATIISPRFIKGVFGDREREFIFKFSLSSFPISSPKAPKTPSRRPARAHHRPSHVQIHFILSPRSWRILMALVP